jgi:uncharacterized phage-like protein YoqJ
MKIKGGRDMKSACFTGHRNLGSDLNRGRLVRCIEKAISKGCDTFICGGALGFDMLAARTVLELKNIHPHIQLHMYLPCANQSERWSIAQKREYYRILAGADLVDKVTRPYYDGCMRERNYKMVDASDLCICYINNIERSGTAQTVRYAKRKGLIIVNVSDLGEDFIDNL